MLLFHAVVSVQITTCPPECFAVVGLCIRWMFWGSESWTIDLQPACPPLDLKAAGTGNRSNKLSLDITANSWTLELFPWFHHRRITRLKSEESEKYIPAEWLPAGSMHCSRVVGVNLVLRVWFILSRKSTEWRGDSIFTPSVKRKLRSSSWRFCERSAA